MTLFLQIAQLPLLVLFVAAGVAAALTLRRHRTLSGVVMAVAVFGFATHLGLEALVALSQTFPDFPLSQAAFRGIAMLTDLTTAALMVLLGVLAARGPGK